MSFAGRGFLGSQMYPTDASRFMAVGGGGFTTAEKRALGYLVNGLAEAGQTINQVDSDLRSRIADARVEYVNPKQIG